MQQVQEDKKDKKAGLIGKISLQDLKYASDVASTSTQSTSSSTKSSNLYESFHKLNSGVGLSIFSQTKKSSELLFQFYKNNINYLNIRHK